MSGLPSGVSYQMTGANASNNLVNITWGFNAASYTVAGNYPVTITATGVGVTSLGSGASNDCESRTGALTLQVDNKKLGPGMHLGQARPSRL